MTRAFLGLGTNLGDRRAELERAVATLRSSGDLVAVSSLYETAPVGGPPQGDFLNLVVELDTDDNADELLTRCQQLEVDAARVRTVRFGPRSLDADVLWVDGVSIESDELTVPHPRMWERRFVLSPLRELAPDLVTKEIEDAAGGDVLRVGTL